MLRLVSGTCNNTVKFRLLVSSKVVGDGDTQRMVFPLVLLPLHLNIQSTINTAEMRLDVQHKMHKDTTLILCTNVMADRHAGSTQAPQHVLGRTMARRANSSDKAQQAGNDRLECGSFVTLD